MDDPRSFSLKAVAGELRLLFTNHLAQDESETAAQRTGTRSGREQARPDRHGRE